jgi:hypothetical protein
LAADAATYAAKHAGKNHRAAFYKKTAALAVAA